MKATDIADFSLFPHVASGYDGDGWEGARGEEALSVHLPSLQGSPALWKGKLRIGCPTFDSH